MIGSIYTKGLLLACIVLTSCEKKKSEPPATQPPACTKITKTPISHPQLVQCKYKLGSYWVIRDSLTGAKDTAKIMGAHSAYGFLPVVGASGYPTTGCDSIEHYWASHITNNKWGFSFDVMPDRLGITGATYNNLYAPQALPGVTLKVLDSLKVSGTWYKKVYQSGMIDIGSEEGNIKADIFFNPAVGPIRIDLFDASGKLTNIKLLTRSHIIL